jgi:hypothetical protein
MAREDAYLMRMSLERWSIHATEREDALPVQELGRSEMFRVVYAREAENAGVVTELENARDVKVLVE